MKLADYAAFALRNTRRQKLRSALTVFAVIIGATSVTIMLALITSVKAFFVHQFDANGEIRHVVVSQQTDLTYDNAGNQGPSTDGTKLTDALAAKIAAIPHVKNVSRVVNPYEVAAVALGSKKLQAQRVEAYDANGVTSQTILAGRDIGAADSDGVITLTQGYAEKLGFAGHPDALVGRSVDLLMQPGYTGVGAVVTQPSFGPGQGQGQGGPQGPGDPNNGPRVALSARVVGIVSSDNSEYGIYMPMHWAIGMMTHQHWDMTDADRRAAEAAQRSARPGTNVTPHMTLITDSDLDQRGYSGFTVEVDQVAHEDAVAKQIRTLGVGAATAQSFIKDQVHIFDIIGYVLAAIGAISLVVATIGVVNTMVMAVLERTREIGVIRACGGTRRAVRRLFTSEAAFLGFVGGAGGVAIGYGLSLIANVKVNEQLASQGMHNSNIIGVPAWLVLSVIAATTLIGTIAGLGPAARAARLDPVTALRYE